MADEIKINQVKINYVSIAEARKMSGLRLILGATAVPGPSQQKKSRPLSDSGNYSGVADGPLVPDPEEVKA